MKLTPHIHNLRARAFTLAEILVVMAIFSMVVAATISSHLFGLKLYRISDAKLTVTADARRVLDHVRNEIWTGKLLYVGNGNAASFTLIPDLRPHVGNALKICPTTDTNTFVVYFWDAADCTLKRTASSNNLVQVIARNVTNQFVFRAEDFQGNAVTNYQNNRVISMVLQVRQPEWSGTIFEYSQLQTRVARRAIE